MKLNARNEGKKKDRKVSFSLPRKMSYTSVLSKKAIISR